MSTIMLFKLIEFCSNTILFVADSVGKVYFCNVETEEIIYSYDTNIISLNNNNFIDLDNERNNNKQFLLIKEQEEQKYDHKGVSDLNGGKPKFKLGNTNMNLNSFNEENKLKENNQNGISEINEGKTKSLKKDHTNSKESQKNQLKEKNQSLLVFYLPNADKVVKFKLNYQDKRIECKHEETSSIQYLERKDQVEKERNYVLNITSIYDVLGNETKHRELEESFCISYNMYLSVVYFHNLKENAYHKFTINLISHHLNLFKSIIHCFII